MKLTKQEYESLVDSRLVDLQNAVTNFKETVSINCDNQNKENLNHIVSLSERLLEAYEAQVEAGEQEQIDEVEREYKKEFGEE